MNTESDQERRGTLSGGIVVRIEIREFVLFLFILCQDIFFGRYSLSNDFNAFDCFRSHIRKYWTIMFTFPLCMNTLKVELDLYFTSLTIGVITANMRFASVWLCS